MRNIENMFTELGENYELEKWENIDIHDYKENMDKLNTELSSGKIGCLLFFSCVTGMNKSYNWKIVKKKIVNVK